MKTFDAALAARLAQEATTFCRCWLLKRSDGVTLGFTDHDREIVFDGVRFAPETGFARTEMERSLGLSVDNLEVAGALRSDAVTEEDIALGLYDGAEITQWLVDWSDVSLRTVLSVGRVGEIRRGDSSFEMEILGISELLNRPMGRIFQRLCDADLGDSRCSATLSAEHRMSATVAFVQDGRRIVVRGEAGNAEAGWFDRGVGQWTTGMNDGARASIRGHFRSGPAGSGEALIELWKAPAKPVVEGDQLVLTAGCDKTATTCRKKFGNLDNFRGFPFLPGEDWLMAYPRGDQAYDGGSLFDV